MKSLERQKRIFIAVSLAVPMILLVGFIMVPAFDLFRMSLTDWDGYSESWNWIWLENYISMMKNENLWLSLKNNAVYFFGHLLFIPIELLFAVLLTSKLRAAKFYKTMVFMSYIINGVAISYAFSYFFSPINGAFDAILGMFHLEALIQNWLSDPKLVNFVLTAVFRLSCHPFYGSASVAASGCAGGGSGGWCGYLAVISVYPDSFDYADGGFCAV